MSLNQGSSIRDIFLGCIFLFLTLLAAHASAVSDERIKQIDSYLQQSALTGFSGAVLIAKDKQVLLNEGYGLADRETERPNTPDTIFDIGSVTKQFTATAILKLVELEKLKVTDHLTRFFEELPTDKQAITLHQLLTHSSGISRVGRGDFDHIPTEQYFSALFEQPLGFEPGSQYRYSNAGYSVLARVVELVSGMEYEAFVDQYLLQPVGMRFTGYLLPDWETEQLAKGYRYSAFDTGSMVTRYKADSIISWVLKGNGGFNSTMGDMYKWYQALSSNQILSADLTQTLTTPYVKEDAEGTSHYAYGWAIFRSPRETKVIAHNGSNGTFFYDFIWLPEEQSVILLATNAQVRDAMRLGVQIEDMLFNDEHTPPPFALDTTSLVIDMALKHGGNGKELIQKVKKELGDALTSKNILNRAGMSLVKHGHLVQSVALFQLNLDLFPGDGNLWDSLGEALLVSNQYQQAKEAFEKSLALGAAVERCYWCDNAKTKLAQAKEKL